MTPEPEIEFLYFEDCPSHEAALERLQTVAIEFALSPDTIRVIRVDTEAAAEQYGFPGSPTIRIDHRDIDPASQDDPPALACRAYRHVDGRITALPPLPLLRQALQTALDARSRNAPGG